MITAEQLARLDALAIDGAKSGLALDDCQDEITTAVRDLVKELRRCREDAWGVIANASNGRWCDQSPEWIGAAERWRDSQIV